jgi:hypothetical protein
VEDRYKLSAADSCEGGGGEGGQGEEADWSIESYWLQVIVKDVEGGGRRGGLIG